MKLLVGLLFSVLAISSTVALPARNPNDDAEIVVVPLEKQGAKRVSTADADPDFKNFQGVIETDSYPFFSLSPYNPLRWNLGYFDNFEDIFTRLREQVARAWSDIPEPGSEDWPLDDDSKGNTTSTVKIVGDHKVVINETVYNKKSEHGNSVYKVRVISVRPLESSEQPDSNANSEKPTETPAEDKTELDKGSPEVFDTNAKNNEIFGNIDSTESTELLEHYSNYTHNITEVAQEEVESEIEEVTSQQQVLSEEQGQQHLTKEDLAIHETQKQDGQQKQQYVESFQGEFSDEFDSSNYGTDTYPNEWEPFEDGDVQYNVNHGSNDIDLYESVPIDLSNDIAVNQILADQGAPFNPDAEVFSVDDLLNRHNQPGLVEQKPSELKSQSLTPNKLQPIK